MTIDQNIKSYLQKVGFTESEVTVYLALLSLGTASISKLAKEAVIPRTTVSDNVTKLIQKGVVNHSIDGSKKALRAESPDRIKLILNKRKLDLDTQMTQLSGLESDLPDIIRSVSDFIPKNNKKSDVTMRYFEGKSSVANVYEEILLADEIRAYANSVDISKIFPSNADLFVNVFADRPNLRVWEIMEDSAYARNYTKNMTRVSGRRFKAKYLSEQLDLSIVDYLIFDDKVAIIEVKQKPTAIIISNSNYATHAKAIFGLVWKLLPQNK